MEAKVIREAGVKRDRISALGIRSFLRIPGFKGAVWTVFWQSGAVNNRKQLKCGRKTYKMGCKLKSIKSRIRSFGTIMRKRIVIIGGGASGLTAAIGGARNGAHVTIVEHMDRVGKKILSTGNGRCNLTNLRMEADCYRCGRKEFPMEVIRGFGVDETLAFLKVLE